MTLRRQRQILEEMNYHNDPRVQAGRRGDWYTEFDQGRMRCRIETYDYEQDDTKISGWVPVHYEVCDLCNGRGSHTNPSIDASGLSDRAFVDEDFAYHYRRGTYDQPCNECHGRRVVPQPNQLDTLTDDERRLVEGMWQAQQDDADHWAEVAAERRMGC